MTDPSSLPDAVTSAVLAPDDRAAKSPRLPVSVVVPAYNRARMLPRCLASVWSQRPFLPAEVIVVDDRSTDDTATVAATLGARVIRHTENRGAWAARNSGIEATTSEWVAFLDSDDEWLPNHIAHLWKLRGNHALVGSSSLNRGTGGHRFHGPVTRKPLVLHSPDVLIGTFNVFTASASMMRRDVALELGGFHDWWGVEDFDMWVRVLEGHTAVCSPLVTVMYNVHDEQISSHEARMLHGHREVAKAHLARTGRSRAPLERFEAVCAWDRMRTALAAGRARLAARNALAALWGVQRIIGVATQLRWRFVVRHRTSRLTTHPEASTAGMVQG